MEIRVDDLSGPGIAHLLQTHLDSCLSVTPVGSAHALDINSLRASDVTFWTVWQEDILMACGALKEIAPDHGEIKSMHTYQKYRGKGIASRLVHHIIAEAKNRHYKRLSLETGSFEAFAPARAAYEKLGFDECPPFAAYKLDPNSVFMSLNL